MGETRKQNVFLEFKGKRVLDKMVCKKCGYQNGVEAIYCANCGRKLSQRSGSFSKVYAMVIACSLIVSVGIGNLIIKDNTNVNNIIQILPTQNGSVAVLYKDGTVKVSGNTHFSQEVSDWEGVTRLYYDHYSMFDGKPILAGTTAENGVLTTEEDFIYPLWCNADELHFLAGGIVCVSKNGYAELYGDVEYTGELLELNNVKDLVYSEIQGIWAVLKTDGTVHILDGYSDPNKVYWNNVKEVRDSGHSIYVIKNDGTIDGGIEDTHYGLNNAVKVVHYLDWIFGISEDGRLLTHNNGNIYINAGAIMVAKPGNPDYGGEVDISQFDQIKDIVVCSGLILLNEDGTVNYIGYEPEWDFESWKDIQKVYGCYDPDWNYLTIYGIRRDGSVIRNRYDWKKKVQTVSEQYCGWKLKDIYVGGSGVVGLTVEGKLVGDGIYENVDFSVFE